MLPAQKNSTAIFRDSCLAADVPPVNQSINGLNNSADALSERLGRLEQRLVLVLKDDDADCCMEKIENTGDGVPLCDMIDHATDRLSGMVGRVDSLLARLAV